MWPKGWDSPKQPPGKDTGVQVGKHRYYADATTAYHGSEGEREMLHARDDHEDLSKQIAPLEWKAVEEDTQQLMVEVADDSGACPYVVDFPLLCPSANKKACKSTSSA